MNNPVCNPIALADMLQQCFHCFALFSYIKHLTWYFTGLRSPHLQVGSQSEYEMKDHKEWSFSQVRQESKTECEVIREHLKRQIWTSFVAC